MQGKPNFAWINSSQQLPQHFQTVKVRYYNDPDQTVRLAQWNNTDGWVNHSGDPVAAPDEWQVTL